MLRCINLSPFHVVETQILLHDYFFIFEHYNIRIFYYYGKKISVAEMLDDYSNLNNQAMHNTYPSKLFTTKYLIDNDNYG